ncbi:MAG: Unknown protein [uncultured Sulfurovum sp.]|uniref:histidine kinase n=1 Tax=uncultured Sulfurovum sp. TaxID=269237 RepID=A0A6S6S8A3_9BACT|nr:MAG: Unknown protein [uncultured Sulfurovum sp.]
MTIKEIKMMKLFQNKTITYIHTVVMSIMLISVLSFITYVIYEEYNEFDREASLLREFYIKKQKKTVSFDTNRVLNFIKHKYENRDLSIDEETLKRTIIETIENLYGREDGTGYIFIYDFSGVKISDPIWPYDVGKNLYDLTDVNGVQVIKELITVAKTNDDNFVEYTWRKPGSAYDSLKVSHAKAFKPWKWMIGTGIYLDEVEKFIDEDQETLQKRLSKHIMEILSLSIILFGISLIGIIVINRIISRELNVFSKFFQKASKSYVLINDNEIYLQRFKEMVTYINSMVEEIHNRKDKLEEMNLLLEKKVEQKTEDLNHLLEKQDSFIKHSIHEINTPLAVIITHLDIFKMKFGDNRYLSKIEAGTKMIANIYDDLSYMVKRDRFVYEKETIDFSEFLESRISFFEEIALGNKHTIVSKMDHNMICYFNKIELQRIIDNNLSNAIKYAKKGTEIMVEVSKESNQTKLQFKTYSTKIEDTKRIFEAFHQEEDLKGGFGLGLEIVGSICSKHDVKIEVQSNEEFTVFSYLFIKGENNENIIA